MSFFRSQAEQLDEAQRMQAFMAYQMPPAMSATDVDLAGVQSVDASFDPARFLAAAVALFRDVRSAYNNANLDAVAGRLAPELAAAMGHQIHAATTLTHQLNMTAIDSVTPELRGVEAGVDGSIHAVVRFHVSGRLGPVVLGADVPPATQLGQLPLRQWFEVWRLARPAGVASPPPASNCPSCGAPASGETHCRYCGALLVDATAEFRIDAIECFG